MKQFGIFRSKLLSSGAALIASATLVGLAGLGAAGSWGWFGLAEARVSAAAQIDFSVDFPICASAIPVRSAAGLMRLAQVEVPRSEMSAVVPAPAFADTDPPLWDGLGSISYKVTTSQAEAQRFFDQGLRLTFAFNHDEARRAFRKAQRLDAGCAMCFWGEALVLGPNINLPMQEDAVAPALAALRKAQALTATASPREQALIAALAARYVDDPKADRAPLDAAYAVAMRKAATQFPDDNEVVVLYAEALMDVSPWDYWIKGTIDDKQVR